MKMKPVMNGVFCAAVMIAAQAAGAAAGGSVFEELRRQAPLAEEGAGFAVPAPQPVLAGRYTMESFEGCGIIHQSFMPKPDRDGAIELLKPCLKSLSYAYGVTFKPAAADIYGTPAIKITIGDSDKAYSMLKEALEERGGLFLGYPVKVRRLGPCVSPGPGASAQELSDWIDCLPFPENLPAQKAVSADVPSPRPFPDMPDLTAAPIGNLARVSEGIFRGEQIRTMEQYRFLREELGVDTVLNLEYFHNEDQELCRKNSLRCAELPLMLFVGKDLSFDWQTFRKAFMFVLAERAEGKKVYFHCLHGSDRTGALAAALMIRDRACGRAYDKAALEEEVDATLERHGFHGRYVFLRRSIAGWVENFDKNQWICK